MLGVGTLVLVAVAAFIYGLYLLAAAPRTRLRRLVVQLQQDPWDRSSSGLSQRASRMLARWVRPYLPSNVMTDLRLRLLWAGHPMGLTAEEFYGLKLALGVVLPALVPLLTLFRGGSSLFFWMLLAACIGFVGPDFWLRRVIEERRSQVQNQLEPFLELVAAAIQAGLSLGEAVRRVAGQTHGLLASEFLRTVQEMAAGKPRREAWQDLLARYPGDEFKATVTAISQGEEFGTSVADLLKVQVTQLRQNRQRQAQRLAQAATVKMRFPMFLFILVPFMVLLLAPAFISLAVSFQF